MEQTRELNQIDGKEMVKMFAKRERDPLSAGSDDAPEDPAATLKAALKYLRLHGYSVFNGKEFGSLEERHTVASLMEELLDDHPDLVSKIPTWLKDGIFQTISKGEACKVDSKGDQRRMTYFAQVREYLEKPDNGIDPEVEKIVSDNGIASIMVETGLA